MTATNLFEIAMGLVGVRELLSHPRTIDATNYEEIQASWQDGKLTTQYTGETYFNMATAIAPYADGMCACIAGWLWFITVDDSALENMGRKTEFEIIEYIKSFEGTEVHKLFSPPKELLHVIRKEHAITAIEQYLMMQAVDWSSIVTTP